MPIYQGQDRHGYYYQYGNQTKYYYNPKSPSDQRWAYDQAHKQSMAIKLSIIRRRRLS